MSAEEAAFDTRFGSTAPASPGADLEAIKRLENLLGRRLPGDIRAFLAWSNGWEGFHGNAYIRVYSVDEMIEANSGRSAEFFPSMIAIGGDGGVELYALDYSRGEPPQLVAIDRNSASPEDIWPIAASFAEGLERLRTQPDGPWQSEK